METESQQEKRPVKGKNRFLVIGAGIGLIIGFVLGNSGVGLVIGAAIGYFVDTKRNSRQLQEESAEN